MKDLAEKLILSKVERYSDNFRKSSSTSGHSVEYLDLNSVFGRVRFKKVVSPNGEEEPLEISAILDHGICLQSDDQFNLDSNGSLVMEFSDNKRPARMADKVRVLARVAFGSPRKE